MAAETKTPAQPSTVRVTNRGPNALCLRAEVAKRALEIDLEVGATSVDAQKLNAILEANPYCGKLIELQCDLQDDVYGNGAFTGKRVQDLSTLAEAEALKAVAACQDAALLRAWVLTDARPKVKKALHLRDRELRPGEMPEDLKVKAVGA